MKTVDYYKNIIKRKHEKKSPQFRSIHSEFWRRFDQNFCKIFEIYHALYGDKPEFSDVITELFDIILQSWIDRKESLKIIDQRLIKNPNWYHDNKMIGGVCYVDLFANNLKGIINKISYFKEIGITYLHLMPFFNTPQGDNDGGYAVSSYREVNPSLGNITDLIFLANELHKNGIILVADFVFNHTSNTHAWALKAKNGDVFYSNFYFIFNDRTIPDEFEKTLREIFPTERQGSFTFDKQLGKWVWTTFHSYQWDLNYSNPNVFNAMVAEMLFLANCGINVLRLDAVAFIWKEMGTNCENLPEAHRIIQAFNFICRIAAPSLCFKSEAIVHPDEVKKYINPNECQLSYNPLLMALLWTCLASQEVRLLNISLQRKYSIHPECAWVNYIRCHDDIGWTFDDKDAEDLHIHGFYHRKWLNEFYTGQFPGSFASGLLFQENHKTGDARISGTTASLAGLEKSLQSADENEINLAIARILLLNGIIFTIGGIPLIYLGDEIGILNDYAFLKDENKANDSRWVHRSKIDWKKYELRNNPESIESRIFLGILKLIGIRKSHPVFSGNDMQIINMSNDHLFGFMREFSGDCCIVISNFSNENQILNASILEEYCFSEVVYDLISEKSFPSKSNYTMKPYEQLILKDKR